MRTKTNNKAKETKKSESSEEAVALVTGIDKATKEEAPAAVVDSIKEVFEIKNDKKESAMKEEEEETTREFSEKIMAVPQVPTLR